MIWLSYFKFV